MDTRSPAARQDRSHAEEEKRTALDILTAAFSRPAQMFKVVRNFITFMQPYWLLAFLTDCASLVPYNSVIRAHSLTLAVQSVSHVGHNRPSKERIQVPIMIGFVKVIISFICPTL